MEASAQQYLKQGTINKYLLEEGEKKVNTNAEHNDTSKGSDGIDISSSSTIATSKSDKTLLNPRTEKGVAMKGILFLCVANSARSQIAEGLARKILEGVANIQSAGSKATILNSLAVEVMKEINIDISNQYSKSVDIIDKSKINIVITLCAEESCPIFKGKTIKFGWALQDPVNPSKSKEEQMAQLREVRDILSIKISELKEYLVASSDSFKYIE
jgi:arsenate reductase